MALRRELQAVVREGYVQARSPVLPGHVSHMWMSGITLYGGLFADMELQNAFYLWIALVSTSGASARDL